MEDVILFPRFGAGMFHFCATFIVTKTKHKHNLEDIIVKRVLQEDVDIGRRIRLQRVNKGMSQSDLGIACGVTFQQIQKYERGANRVGGGRLKQIADALGVTPGHFFANNNGMTNGDEVATSETLDLLTKPGALRLLRSYAKLSPARRDAVSRVCVMMAGDMYTED
jgi:transcriptional regulator with XRE-family HTH domain